MTIMRFVFANEFSRTLKRHKINKVVLTEPSEHRVYQQANFLNAKRSLPGFCWTANTQLNCLKQLFKKPKKMLMLIIFNA